MNIRRIILQTSCLATNYPCNELSGNELSMRRIVLATNCPATNCPATNCPCNELSATNCPQRIVLQRIVRSPFLQCTTRASKNLILRIDVRSQRRRLFVKFLLDFVHIARSCM